MGMCLEAFVEQRQADGAWVPADKWEPEDGDDPWVPYEKRLVHTYNEWVWGALGGITAGFSPIAQARGLPADVSAHIMAHEGLVDEHTFHSWLTVREIMEYDWTQDVRQWFPSDRRYGPAQPLYAHCTEFLAQTLPRLWRLGRAPWDDVRIVFWFDV